MKTLRDVPVHDGKKFYWCQGIGSADTSDLYPVVSRRVYADACDIGFYVRSHRTGHVVLFTHTKTTKRGDEVISWTYQSAAGVRIVIYND